MHVQMGNLSRCTETVKKELNGNGRDEKSKMKNLFSQPNGKLDSPEARINEARSLKNIQIEIKKTQEEVEEVRGEGGRRKKKCLRFIGQY